MTETTIIPAGKTANGKTSIALVQNGIQDGLYFSVIQAAHAGTMDIYPINESGLDERTPDNEYEAVLAIADERNGGIQRMDRISVSFPDIPIIAVVEEENPNWEQLLLDGIVQDYIPAAELTGRSLNRAVSHAVARHGVLKRLDRERVTAKYLAYHDTLTTLPNRQLFFDRLIQTMAHAKRNREGIAVLYIDLDGFKAINDTYGHSAGDLLLKNVALRLKNSLRESETAARLGGDEFGIILEDVSHRCDAGIVARRILDAMAPSFIVTGIKCRINTSIGISVYPQDGESPERLIHCADTAMYKAKQEGGSGYIFYSSIVSRWDREHPLQKMNIRKAIEKNQIILYYQPQVSCSTGKIVGVEALVRWNHPELGILPPEQFIPGAEQTGMIVPLGYRVVEEACRNAAAWVNRRFGPVPVWVNLSMRQLWHGEIIEAVQNAVKATGIGPNLLVLEITESGSPPGWERTIGMLGLLRKTGVSLAIDDFGTGYSSLSYLKQMPVDSIKIDRSFIAGLPGDPGNSAIVRALLSMARSLGLSVTAEGVETEEQFEFLRRKGCDRVQGNFCSPPVRMDRIEALLETQSHAG